MADAEQVRLLVLDRDAWNEWRAAHPKIVPNLEAAELRGATLRARNLGAANLQRADLHRTDLGVTRFVLASLDFADLSGADMRRADLRRANLTGANLRGANLHGALLGETNFGGTNLTDTQGLNQCAHSAPSILDWRVLKNFPHLPLSFLRGCGLPDRLIEYLPSLREEAIQSYTCFISYSSADQMFAERLYADLQNNGVRCWFAPEDMRIGDKIWDAIEEAICLRDKVVLILSEASITSEWVEDEVTKAFAEERSRKQLVLLPIRLDDAVMETNEPWATKLRDNRNIGDFRNWKNHDAYQEALARLLRDLVP